MCPVTRRAVHISLIAGIFLILYGCFLHPVIGPGYTLSVSVADAAHLKLEDIDFLDHVAVKEGFGQRRPASLSDEWECIHYVRDLNEPQFQHLQQYKFITLGWCYDFVKGQSSDIKRNIKHFNVGIDNDWVGQDPTIKQEIDRLGDVFYKALVERFGKENVKIERRRTGPPF